MENNILVVEDDFANQQVAVLFLKKFGYSTEIADNGAIAVEMALHKKYSLILMDCQMPIMDGFTSTRTIRSSEGLNQKTPIIALTANLVSGIHGDCEESGMDDILNKPVTMKAMQAMVTKWIDCSSDFQP